MNKTDDDKKTLQEYIDYFKEYIADIYIPINDNAGDDVFRFCQIEKQKTIAWAVSILEGQHGKNVKLIIQKAIRDKEIRKLKKKLSKLENEYKEKEEEE